MKIFTKKNILISVLLMLISILTIEMIILNYFYDEEMLANDYYEIFLNEHGDSVPEIYHCNKQNVINKKQYQIKNRYYVTFFCDNGKAVVYRFKKGLGRSVMLSNWWGY